MRDPEFLPLTGQGSAPSGTAAPLPGLLGSGHWAPGEAFSVLAGLPGKLCRGNWASPLRSRGSWSRDRR